MKRRKARKSAAQPVPLWHQLLFLALGVATLFAALSLGLFVAAAQPWPWLTVTGGLVLGLLGLHVWVGSWQASYWWGRWGTPSRLEIAAAIALAMGGSAHLLPGILEARDRNLRLGEAAVSPGWELVWALVLSAVTVLSIAALWVWAIRRALRP
jgi:hypothetical protein